MANETPVKFVEYGKYFLSDGSSDYSVLAYTEGGKEHLKAYSDYIQLQDNTYFDEEVGNISAMLLPIDEEKFLFAQLHRRSEGELNPEKSPTNRPFTQIRYIQLNEHDFAQYLKSGYSPLLSLVYQNPMESRSRRFHLNTYRKAENLIAVTNVLSPLVFPWELHNENLDYPPPLLYQYQVGQLSSTINNFILYLADVVAEHASVIVVDDGKLEFIEKLLIIQSIQTLVYPKKGLVSFALDPITKRNVNIQFSKVMPTHSTPKTKILELTKIKDFHARDNDGYSYWTMKFFNRSPEEYGERERKKDWIEANRNIHNEVFVNSLRSGLSPKDSFTLFLFNIGSDAATFKSVTGYSRKNIFEKLVATHFVSGIRSKLPVSAAGTLLTTAIQNKYTITNNCLVALKNLYSGNNDIGKLIKELERLQPVDLSNRNLAYTPQDLQKKNMVKNSLIEQATLRIRSINLEEPDAIQEETRIAFEMIDGNLNDQVRPLLYAVQELFDDIVANWQEVAQRLETPARTTHKKRTVSKWLSHFSELPGKFLKVILHILGYLLLFTIIALLLKYLLR